MRNSLGAFGEAWAVALLSRQGYRIIDRNVRFREGEIDIVAQEGDDLVFVEVKCRRSTAFGSPESSIDARRFRRLAHAIARYLQVHDLNPEGYRVDVVALQVSPTGKVETERVLRGVESPLD